MQESTDVDELLARMRANDTEAAAELFARYRERLRRMEEAGVDQTVFIQQAGRNQHEHICESLELFAKDVMPEFAARRSERERKKAAELAPYIEAALARKQWMKPLAESEIPVVKSYGRSDAQGAPNIESR